MPEMGDGKQYDSCLIRKTMSVLRHILQPPPQGTLPVNKKDGNVGRAKVALLETLQSYYLNTEWSEPESLGYSIISLYERYSFGSERFFVHLISIKLLLAHVAIFFGHGEAQSNLIHPSVSHRACRPRRSQRQSM